MDLDQLLAPIAADSPCGEDLEYDAAFGEMERAAAGKAEQQIGEHVVEAEEPDWRDVKKKTLELLKRTKDLRVATYLTQALLRTEQFAGLRDGLALLSGLVERYWDSVHPQLDPDDDNDPTLRINTIMTLCDANSTLHQIRLTPLVASRSAGIFSLRDVQIAAGEYPAPSDEKPPDPQTIDAAFQDVDLTELQGIHQTLSESVAHVAGMEALITDYVGVSNAPSLDPLRKLLIACEQIVQRHLERRGVGLEAEATDGEQASGEQADGASGTGNGSGAGVAAGPRLTGEIHTREDVIRALDKICEYYERHEPSSPLPLLIRRAKRLASKSFLEIIRDLAPDALTQAQSIGGMSEGEAPATEAAETKETKSDSGW
jgi:type VI secretion system protein ImpA